MKVSKWGNSLAVRLPSSVVEALSLEEGADVTIRIVDDRTFEIERDHRREKALDRIRSFRKPLPPDWKFDRDDANAR
ncbi:MAG: AbrB/MazE/SpoVT family DNA-binding domain-containing protein [Alphaproteobacteria bacterium GM202ARS2]|nr:AbrB/MazE/SpoVT family DNA-binding domain-containing protein [Alphaproteobacteria bacterium GM202ARS2]